MNRWDGHGNVGKIVIPTLKHEQRVQRTILAQCEPELGEEAAHFRTARVDSAPRVFRIVAASLSWFAEQACAVRARSQRLLEGDRAAAVSKHYRGR